MDKPRYRDDIRRPESGEKIPLNDFSIARFTEQILFVYCPMCRVSHQFNPVR